MRPAPGGRAHAGPLDRVAGVLPVGEPADVAADVAVPVGGEGGERGGRVLTAGAGGVEDDLVVAAQRLQRAAGAGEAQRAGDVLGPEGPPTNRHDQLDVLAGVKLGLELLPADGLHGRFFPSPWPPPSVPVTARPVGAGQHAGDVIRDTGAAVGCGGPTGRPAGSAGA